MRAYYGRPQPRRPHSVDPDLSAINSELDVERTRIDAAIDPAQRFITASRRTRDPVRQPIILNGRRDCELAIDLRSSQDATSSARKTVRDGRAESREPAHRARSFQEHVREMRTGPLDLRTRTDESTKCTKTIMTFRVFRVFRGYREESPRVQLA